MATGTDGYLCTIWWVLVEERVKYNCTLLLIYPLPLLWQLYTMFQAQVDQTAQSVLYKFLQPCNTVVIQ